MKPAARAGVEPGHVVRYPVNIVEDVVNLVANGVGDVALRGIHAGTRIAAQVAVFCNLAVGSV